MYQIFTEADKRKIWKIVVITLNSELRDKNELKDKNEKGKEV